MSSITRVGSYDEIDSENFLSQEEENSPLWNLSSNSLSDVGEYTIVIVVTLPEYPMYAPHSSSGFSITEGEP